MFLRLEVTSTAVIEVVPASGDNLPWFEKICESEKVSFKALELANPISETSFVLPEKTYVFGSINQNEDLHKWKLSQYFKDYMANLIVFRCLLFYGKISLPILAEFAGPLKDVPWWNERIYSVWKSCELNKVVTDPNGGESSNDFWITDLQKVYSIMRQYKIPFIRKPNELRTHPTSATR